MSLELSTSTPVFGQSFTIESDHKPLEQINLKNLADTPAHLQRMLFRLQNYDVTIKYKPGKQMILTDALSQYAPQVSPEVPLDNAIHHVHITPEKKLEFQQTIQDDPLLKSLAEIIVAGWPENTSDVPNVLRPYHNHHDELTVEDGTLSSRKKLSSYLQLKGRRYYTRSMKDTKESLSASTEHNIVFTGQASMKTSNAW